MSVAAVASLAVLAAAVQVEGTTSCPSPDMVLARLSELLSADAVSAQPDRARLWEEGDELVILLERPDGALLGTRRLPRTYSCEDLASAASVSLAAWESDVHPEFAPRWIGRPGDPLLVARPAPAPAAAPARPTWKVNGGVALELGGSVDVPAMAGGLMMGAWLTPPGRLTSLRAAIEGQSERQMTLGDGRAAWRRWILGLGLERPFFTGPDGEGGRLRWFALAQLAWLDLRGEGFTVNHKVSAFDVGAGAGARAVLTTGRWWSCVELAASLWPVRHDILASGPGEVARLPTMEVFVRIGAGLAFVR